MGEKPKSAIDRQVRQSLVNSLYASPISILIGALCGSGICLVAAITTGDPLLKSAAILVTIVALIRVAMLLWMRDDPSSETTKFEWIFGAGAFAYAGALGLVATLSIVREVSADARLILIVLAIGFATAITARNAGRPIIALGQLLLVLAPVTIAMLISGSPLLVVLGVATLLHGISAISVTFSVHRSLQKATYTAENNAQLAEEMQGLARSDVVTGLANRAGLNHAIAQAMENITDTNQLALIWIDLDRFKEVNDLLGHPVGDKVLKEVAQRLKEISPEENTVARFGGDEFIVFCAVENIKDAERIASEIHLSVMQPMRIDGELLDIRASLGVALLPDHADDAEQLLQRADLALYQAKVGGRAQTRFYEPVMSRDLLRRREIEAELRTAIQRDELSIFFQPIVDLETSRIKSFEALVRWFHPEKGELSPGEFIPVAEETGVIVTLGNWITVQAAKVAATWPEDVTLSVNLSPLQIRAPGAALGIKNALREAGLSPDRLELEVTESLFIDDNHATADFIEDLSEMGVRFALDDFGTGYSSLSYINSFPFSKIKVDRSFVSGSQVGKKSEAIIQAVAKMGQMLDMDIVAEGLETPEQVNSVRKAGCNLGQGYHFSRAVPDYLAAMLLSQEREGDQPSEVRRASA